MKFMLSAIAALCLSLTSNAQCGTEPTSGTTTISANGILNSYYPGTGNPVSGATTLTVGAIDSRGSATALAANDLVMIMQMQGADFNSTNGDTYGDGVSGGFGQGYLTTNLVAGRYEYGTVASISGSVLTLQSGLVNSYFTRAFASGAIQSYQVIRIPRNFNFTLNASVTVTAPFWNGATGGVVVLDAVNTMTLNGTINVNGLGFRGGAGQQKNGATTGNSNGSTAIANTDFRFPSLASNSANATGGTKGEGISGTPNLVFASINNSTTILTGEGYLNGNVGRGAPGNAGGGSTDGQPGANGYNTGGGGGGNGGAGGIGGSGWHGGSGTVSSFPYGGHGGAAFAQRQINRVVMGGGGGAGTGNNGTTTNEFNLSGASGGGIILVRAGSFAGTGGSLQANGAAAIGLIGTGGAGQTDAAGGGGGGGTIIAVTRTSVANGLGGISASAVGGRGGDAQLYYEHGPGGGGGGGVIIATGTFSSSVITAGTSGLTRLTNNTNPVSSPYGAANGSDGILITMMNPPVFMNATFGNSACGVLPIQLQTFSAAQSSGSTVLDWSVDRAVNFAGFEVQFSTNGTDFVPLSQISFSESQLKYQYTHSGSTASVNYYRLKLNDKDGSFSYSKTLVVRTNSTTKELLLYPQPARGFTTVQVSALSRQQINIQLLSANGSKVAEKQVQLVSGSNIFLIDNLERLSSGIYTVRMRIDGKVQTAKLLINK
ncbi:MAG: T9SS type A sorting domain-containing protein [Flavitalea sp.]